LVDGTIPTVDLGVPNTERGHCGKTMAILHHIKKKLKDQPDIKWIVVADDDTILG
jgi:UDP-glucose:O-linked fucose beta-1,3-glucosyltransferase